MSIGVKVPKFPWAKRGRTRQLFFFHVQMAIKTKEDGGLAGILDFRQGKRTGTHQFLGGLGVSTPAAQLPLDFGILGRNKEVAEPASGSSGVRLFVRRQAKAVYIRAKVQVKSARFFHGHAEGIIFLGIPKLPPPFRQGNGVTLPAIHVDHDRPRGSFSGAGQGDDHRAGVPLFDGHCLAVDFDFSRFGAEVAQKTKFIHGFKDHHMSDAGAQAGKRMPTFVVNNQ